MTWVKISEHDRPTMGRTGEANVFDVPCEGCGVDEWEWCVDEFGVCRHDAVCEERQCDFEGAQQAAFEAQQYDAGPVRLHLVSRRERGLAAADDRRKASREASGLLHIGQQAAKDAAAM